MWFHQKIEWAIEEGTKRYSIGLRIKNIQDERIGWSQSGRSKRKGKNKLQRSYSRAGSKNNPNWFGFGRCKWKSKSLERNSPGRVCPKFSQTKGRTSWWNIQICRNDQKKRQRYCRSKGISWKIKHSPCWGSQRFERPAESIRRHTVQQRHGKRDLTGWAEKINGFKTIETGKWSEIGN